MAANVAMPVPANETTKIAPERVLSVDVLRGFTVALMLLVNDPGDWEHLFKQLDHAAWNGWTLTDLVFPTFLFLMGAAMVFSFDVRSAKGDCRWTQAGKLFSRAGKIFALNLMLTFFPRMHWTHLRYYGVLTRIALCYLLAGLVLLGTRRVRVLAAIIVGILLVYWVLLRWVPVPGAGMPVRNIPLLDPVQNLTAWVDRAVVGFTQHWIHAGRLYKKTSDPEGLLSTLPAVASTLLGALAGMWMKLRSADGGGKVGPRLRRTEWMLALAGVAGIGVGELWSVWLPANKNLWTSSYVVLAGGFAALALAGCSWLVDGRLRPWPRWMRAATWPWLVFGSNAIAAFVISEVIVKTMIAIKLTDADGDLHSLWELAYEQGIGRWGSNEWTSLAFAVMFVAICFLPNWWLWRKRIFLKV